LNVKETWEAGRMPPQAPRTHRSFRATTILLLALAAFPLAGQRAELERRILRRTLPNGLDVIVVENRGVPLVTIEADVKNGSFTQGPEFEGLSHLYEHMFFKANADYPNPDDFIGRASQLGASFNGTTSEERVNYYLTVPADSVDGGMKFLAAALMKPAFRRDELEREREVVIGEYNQDEARPGFRFMTAMGKTLWGAAWSRKNPLGERKVIQSTTPEKMRFIQERYYVPNNTAVIITGDIAPDKAFALATNVFGSWKRGADPFAANPIPPVPALARDTAVIVEEPIGSVIVMLQWHGPSATKDAAATYAADVFSDVLNQPGSRFQRRLVDSGLFQAIGVNYYTLNQVGPITIQGQTTPERLRAALSALRDEIKLLADTAYFSSEELEATKQHRIVSTMQSLERASGFAHQLGFWWAVTGLDYFYGYVETMARQTPADLQRYASTYIIGRPHVTGVLLSPQSRRQLGLTEGMLVDTGVRP
jgi:zinc protease